MDKNIHLSENIADLLREVGNIGAAHAATALSQILHQPVGMEVPWVELVPFDDITEVLGGPEEVVACVYLRVEGEIQGNIFFVQSVPAARELVRQLMPVDSEPEEFSELELSALAEMGNIMAATYLSSLMDFTRLKMAPSVPLVAIDMAQAVLSVGLLAENPAGDFALVIHTTIQHKSAVGNAHFFLLPDPGMDGVLLKALGIEVSQ